MLFKPVCLNCKAEIGEIAPSVIANEGSMEGGRLSCPVCGEKYHKMIYEGKLKLTRVSVPAGFAGSTEQIFESISTYKTPFIFNLSSEEAITLQDLIHIAQPHKQVAAFHLFNDDLFRFCEQIGEDEVALFAKWIVSKYKLRYFSLLNDSLKAEALEIFLSFAATVDILVRVKMLNDLRTPVGPNDLSVSEIEQDFFSYSTDKSDTKLGIALWQLNLAAFLSKSFNRKTLVSFIDGIEKKYSRQIPLKEVFQIRNGFFSKPQYISGRDVNVVHRLLVSKLNIN